MGNQDRHPDLVTGADNGPPSLFLVATIANLHEIELAFGQYARLKALRRLRDSIHHLFGGEEIHTIKDDGLIEITVRPDAQRRPDYPGRLIGQLCALVCADPILSESGPFFAIPTVGSAIADSGRTGIEAARMQVRLRPIHFRHSLKVPQYRDDMRKAVHLLEQVASGHATMVWQPIVASGPGSFVLYHESLLRVRNDDENLVSCEPALRALERIDLAPELDRRLMSLVLDELETDPTLRLGINISARSASFHRHGRNALWNELRERMDRKPSLARRLVIEITETADFVSLEEASEFVSLMQDLGCTVAVDDFGAGCGSIIQLSALAADIIKIDGSFIRSGSQSDQGYATFLHLVRLCTSLASTVVVEGIETARQAELARKAGADWLQGYHFGRPSPDRLPPMADERETIPSLEAIASRSSPSQENSVAI